MMRDMPGAATYYTTYEYFTRLFTPPPTTTQNSQSNTANSTSAAPELSVGAVLIAGGMAGVAQWTLSIPADVIKSRIQSAPPGVYNGFIDAAIKLVGKEGPRVLFRGLGTVVVTSFPTNAVGLLGRAVGLEALHRMF
jgi:solute carrier family 25 carnitine/acylcarnitine transporter 20/29